MGFVRGFEELRRSDIDVAGGKGANLGELTRGGFPVPPGFVLTTAAYREFVVASGIADQVLASDDADRTRTLFSAAPVPDATAAELLAAHAALGADAVAVRSSATAEDLEDASFAGQQDTFLHVVGPDALLVAVRDCWASLWTERAVAYRARQGIDPASVALAVVVQQMVAADSAGVLFTANPTNGRRDESVVSAAWGLGESVVSGSVTTDDVVVDRAGRVRSRATADKAVMTVTLATGTQEQPVPAARRAAPVLDDAAAVELAALGTRIEAHFGAPQDIEWARAGGTFWIVQSRPITALPEPEAEPPTDWTVPDPTAFYARASIVEQLPDPLTPLFADLVDPSVARSLKALMNEFLGGVVIRDGDVGLPTINGYAYYGYSRTGMVRLLVRSPGALKVLTTTGERSGLLRWRNLSHPRYVSIVEGAAARPLDGMSDADLLAGVIELLDAGTEYYTAVQTIIPLAAASEVAFTQFYERLVRRRVDEPPAATFLLGFDSMPILAEKSLYDLATWVRTRPELTAALLGGGGGTPEWEERFRAHLDRFGHTVYNLDFANAVPADDPGPVLDTLRFYLRGGGSDPYERQRRSADRRETATAAVLARLDPVRRNIFIRLLRWAQSVAPVREDALADIGLAWPQLRRMLHELGERLTRAGVIDGPDDVFWLRRDEIPAGAAAGAIERRRMVWRGQRRVTPPQLLPESALWMSLERFLPAASGEQTGSVLRGTGASAGQVTATARVLAGPQDFGRMQPGDVLVASITTPAWTTLFAMASAVVTDIGGPLSHSSIVAREYGIPAVLGTAVATRRIVDGERIHVDGDAGTVTLVDQDTPDAEPMTRTYRGQVVAGAAAVGLGAMWWVRRRRR